MKGAITIFICVLLSTASSLFINYKSQFFNSDWWWSLLFFTFIFIITNLVFNWKTNAASHAESVFGLILVKTLFLFIAVFLYSLYNKAQLASFSVHFISHYILFTVIEIRYLLHLIKKRVI